MSEQEVRVDAAAVYAGGPVVAHAVVGSDGSPTCWLWWAAEQPAAIGVTPVRGNPRNVHAGVYWLVRLRVALASGQTPEAALVGFAAAASGEYGRVQADGVRWATLAEVRAASIATD